MPYDSYTNKPLPDDLQKLMDVVAEWEQQDLTAFIEDLARMSPEAMKAMQTMVGQIVPT
jgi:hypothetical protein